MLTDTALRNLKPKSKIYKPSDRDGVYVTVSPSGTVTNRRGIASSWPGQEVARPRRSPSRSLGCLLRIFAVHVDCFASRIAMRALASCDPG